MLCNLNCYWFSFVYISWSRASFGYHHHSSLYSRSKADKTQSRNSDNVSLAVFHFVVTVFSDPINLFSLSILRLHHWHDIRKATSTQHWGLFHCFSFSYSMFRLQCDICEISEKLRCNAIQAFMQRFHFSLIVIINPLENNWDMSLSNVQSSLLFRR